MILVLFMIHSNMTLAAHKYRPVKMCSTPQRGVVESTVDTIHLCVFGGGRGKVGVGGFGLPEE